MWISIFCLVGALLRQSLLLSSELQNNTFESIRLTLVSRLLVATEYNNSIQYLEQIHEQAKDLGNSMNAVERAKLDKAFLDPIGKILHLSRALEDCSGSSIGNLFAGKLSRYVYENSCTRMDQLPINSNLANSVDRILSIYMSENIQNLKSGDLDKDQKLHLSELKNDVYKRTEKALILNFFAAKSTFVSPLKDGLGKELSELYRDVQSGENIEAKVNALSEDPELVGVYEWFRKNQVQENIDRLKFRKAFYEDTRKQFVQIRSLNEQIFKAEQRMHFLEEALLSMNDTKRGGPEMSRFLPRPALVLPNFKENQDGERDHSAEKSFYQGTRTEARNAQINSIYRVYPESRNFQRNANQYLNSYENAVLAGQIERRAGQGESFRYIFWKRFHFRKPRWQDQEKDSIFQGKTEFEALALDLAPHFPDSYEQIAKLILNHLDEAMKNFRPEQDDLSEVLANVFAGIGIRSEDGQYIPLIQYPAEQLAWLNAQKTRISSSLAKSNPLVLNKKGAKLLQDGQSHLMDPVEGFSDSEFEEELGKFFNSTVGALREVDSRLKETDTKKAWEQLEEFGRFNPNVLTSVLMTKPHLIPLACLLGKSVAEGDQWVNMVESAILYSELAAIALFGVGPFKPIQFSGNVAKFVGWTELPVWLALAGFVLPEQYSRYQNAKMMLEEARLYRLAFRDIPSDNFSRIETQGAQNLHRTGIEALTLVAIGGGPVLRFSKRVIGQLRLLEEAKRLRFLTPSEISKRVKKYENFVKDLARGKY